MFDRWRNRLVTVSYTSGTSFFGRDLERVQRWKPYAARAEAADEGGPPRRPYIPHAKAFSACEAYLATMPDMDALTSRTIDLWDPTTLEHLATTPLPEGERPRWIALSPDGRMMITPTKDAGHRGPHPFRVWKVARR